MKKTYNDRKFRSFQSGLRGRERRVALAMIAQAPDAPQIRQTGKSMMTSRYLGAIYHRLCSKSHQRLKFGLVVHRQSIKLRPIVKAGV